MSGDRAKELFLEALDRPADERERFLEGECAGAPDLRRRVDALLEAHGAAGDVLGEQPVAWTGLIPTPADLARPGSPPLTPVDPSGGTDGRGSADADAATVAETEDSAVVDLGPGDQVGVYRLVSELGHGGFGTVFLAAQEQPVRRQVALKIVKLGMDTRAVVRRFESERQALALMDHPNIARVLDAGATETGRPFFVMELVDGVPITEYCQRHDLGRTERLKLFVTVCEAIQHAHQKGVIHRDVKPTNVLVATIDGRPVAKVIDFGIAKATAQAWAERTFVTREGHVIGTPAYMSPEQLDSAGDVDTRSDVYSLGVLLYELLCGEAPFDMRSASFAEMARLIREVDPPRPGTRRPRTKGERTTTTQVAVPSDLDWVVMRCLEKERGRRYPTALDLALDIGRFLDERPVEAAPPSAWYRVRKLARRHRAASIAVVAVAAMFLLGAVGTSLGLIAAERANVRLDEALDDAQREAERARLAEDRAAEEAREAQLQADIARSVADFLNKDLLGAVEPSIDPGRGRDVLVREVLDVAAERIEEAAAPGGRFEGAPLVVAEVRQTIGDAYAALGAHQQAAESIAVAADVRTRELGPDHRQTLGSRRSLGHALGRLGRLEEAEDLLRPTIEWQRITMGAESAETLATRHVLAVNLLDQGRVDESVEMLERARDDSVRALGEYSSKTIGIMGSLAIAYATAGRGAESEHLLRRQLEVQRASLGAGAPDTLVTMVNLGNVLRTQGRTEEAEPFYVEAVDSFEEVMGPEHPDTLTASHSLGRLWISQGRYAEAESLLVRLLEVSRRVVGEDRQETLEVQSALSLVYKGQGRYSEAEALSADALEVSRASLGPDHPDTLQRAKELISIFYFRDKMDRVETLTREILEGERRLHGESHPATLNSRMNMGILAFERGDHAEAEEWMRSTLELAEEALGPHDSTTMTARGNLATLLNELGRFEESEAFCRESVTRARQAFSPTHELTATLVLQWGGSLMGLHRFEESEPLLLEGFDIFDTHYGRGHYRTEEAVIKLATLYEWWGKEDELARWEALLEEMGAEVEGEP